MLDPTPPQNRARVLRKFSSFDEQEAETLRHWMTRTVAERLEAAADLARHAYSIRPIAGSGDQTSNRLGPALNEKEVRVRPSRILRKFGSFEEQEAWNLTYAGHE